MSIRKSARIAARSVVKAVRRSPRLALEPIKEAMREEVAVRAQAAAARFETDLIEEAKEAARIQVAERTEAALDRLFSSMFDPTSGIAEEARLKDRLTFEELVGDYHYSDDHTRVGKDLALRKLFIEQNVFKPCIHAEFGDLHYAGILVAVHQDIIDHACGGFPVPVLLRMVGPRLYNIENGSCEGYLTQTGIWWEE